MSFLPKLPCDVKDLNFAGVPPGFFISRLMQLAVMAPAERNGEFVADLQTDRARLCKTQMVRIARCAAADQAGLGSDELQVRLVTQPLGFGDGELAFVDAS